MRDDLLAAIAAGAPPFERLRHPAFARRAGARHDERDAGGLWLARVGSWYAAAGSELPDPAAVEAAFAPAVVNTDEHLPDWAEYVLLFVAWVPDDGFLASEDPTSMFTPALLPLASELLDWPAVRERRAVTDRVLLSLTRHLATRILLVCWAVLELETATQSAPRWDVGRTAWRERLSAFPGIAFPLGTTIRQWRQACLEIIDRLGADLPALRAAWLGDRRLGRLDAVAADLGDRHDDGRSVAILTFESGDRLVYKPKDLECGTVFCAVIDVLNENARGGALLPRRGILNLGSHGWEEYVEQHSAEGEEAAELFFRAFGRILRVLQLVEARDFWVDNLLVRGTSPDFADLECILHPRLGKADGPVGIPATLFEESVLPTAAVSHRVGAEAAPDFGALAGPGPRIVPVGTWSGFGDRVNGDFRLSGGELTWNPSMHWPRLDGLPASAPSFTEAIVSGYREADALVRRSAARLGALGESMLATDDSCRVRVLMRDTWQYMALLRGTIQPQSVLDGNSRELSLLPVLGSAPRWFSDGADPRRFTIAWSELQSLRRLDIPQFHNFPAGSAIELECGVRIDRVFEGSATARFRSRLAGAGEFDLDRHCDLLRYGIAQLPMNAPAPP